MINNIVIMGRLTATPEVKSTSGGVNYTNFTVAVERNVKNKDGERQTDFIPCTAWRGAADFIGRHFTKGRMIAVSGELQMRKYTDKDGNSRTAFDVLANNVSFCGDSGAGAAQPAAETKDENLDEQTPFAGMVDDDDELPF